eukprot:3667644-Rhodomonas_salina.3
MHVVERVGDHPRRRVGAEEGEAVVVLEHLARGVGVEALQPHVQRRHTRRAHLQRPAHAVGSCVSA